MALSPTALLENRYRIERLLSQGGMGVVYQGFDTKLKISVALKENFFRTAQSIYQFEQEALILARLRHSNLPHVIDHFSYEGRQYLVMDYIEGQDLWEVIRDLGHPLEEQQALNYINQVCEAARYLHEEDPPVIHRDIKPENIKITPKGRAVLVDFGIAKLQDESTGRTSTGARGVTPGFSPPEQYGGVGTNPASDIYALGATLYAVLTGQNPPNSITLMIGETTLDPPDAINPALSRRVSQAIEHAMQIKKEDRPQTVREWQRELLGLSLADDSLETRPLISPAPTTPQPAAKTGPDLLERPDTSAATVFSQRELPLQKPPFFKIGLGLAVLAISLIGYLAWQFSSTTGGQDQADGVGVSHLCVVEENFVRPISMDSAGPREDLLAYYRAANPALFNHLDSVAQMYRDDQAHRGVTYIMGAAGVGKSFAIRNLLTDIPDAGHCTVKLGDLFGEEMEKLDFEVIEKPDLASMDGQIVFNTLPTLAQSDAFELDRLLLAADCLTDGRPAPLVIIDDLDEIHPDAAETILRAVDDFILDSSPERLIHMTVLGRPEAFTPWLRHPRRTEQNESILEAFVLRGPDYSTAADLTFRIRDYYAFTGELDELEQNGQIDADVDRFIETATAYPFLTYSIGNLAVGNAAIQQISLTDAPVEQSLKAGIYDDLLYRNSQSHGRPPGAASDYGRLLEEIAVRYVDDVDEEGFFVVRFEDAVDIHDDAGNVVGAVFVRNVLDHSGLAFVDAAHTAAARYRFDPFWVHSHLVERYKQRLNPSHEYHSCYARSEVSGR